MVFREKRLTYMALLKLIDKVSNEVDNKQFSIGLLFCIYLFILFFASMTNSHSNISKMTIKSVIPSGQHKGVATHQPPLTVLQDIL